jgi:low affinity Fe/Cu permease
MAREQKRNALSIHFLQVEYAVAHVCFLFSWQKGIVVACITIWNIAAALVHFTSAGVLAAVCTAVCFVVVAGMQGVADAAEPRCSGCWSWCPCCSVRGTQPLHARLDWVLKHWPSSSHCLHFLLTADASYVARVMLHDVTRVTLHDVAGIC